MIPCKNHAGDAPCDDSERARCQNKLYEDGYILTCDCVCHDEEPRP